MIGRLFGFAHRIEGFCLIAEKKFLYCGKETFTQRDVVQEKEKFRPKLEKNFVHDVEETIYDV